MKLFKELCRKFWFLLPTLLLGCSPCNDDLIQQVSSPGNQRVATASLQNCGATTSFYTRVVVKPIATPSHEIEQLVFSVRNKQELKLSWKSASELVVTCNSCRSDEIEYQLLKAGSLRISYELH